jgi:dihydrofolate synthase/folylpolyglutamate synthase
VNQQSLLIVKKNGDTLSFVASTGFLFGLEKFGVKMGLQNIRSLMEYAGNPHDRLKAVHVAGTNGKGSTCAMIASILSSMGYKVGLYTSPHIVSFTERIRINGEPISEKDVCSLTDFFRPEITRLRATFFEATTAIAFKYFVDQNVDYAVIETGLGGRLDATNIINPLVSVITGIGLDHTEILGDTLEKIAFEKAGIIKSGKPVVVNVKSESLKEVFRTVARERNSEIFFVNENSECSNVAVKFEGLTIDAKVFGVDYPGLKVGLTGLHQIQNSLTTLSALHILNMSRVKVNREAIYEGFSQIAQKSGIRGRLEIVSRKPLIIVDVAHNPEGIESIIKSLDRLRSGKGVLLFAVMRDKDAFTMLNSLREMFETIILTSLHNHRAMGTEELKNLSENVKLNAQVFSSPLEALRAAISECDGDRFLLITGSHYLAGEVMPLLTNSRAILGLTHPNMSRDHSIGKFAEN